MKLFKKKLILEKIKEYGQKEGKTLTENQQKQILDDFSALLRKFGRENKIFFESSIYGFAEEMKGYLFELEESAAEYVGAVAYIVSKSLRQGDAVTMKQGYVNINGQDLMIVADFPIQVCFENEMEDNDEESDIEDEEQTDFQEESETLPSIDDEYYND